MGVSSGAGLRKTASAEATASPAEVLRAKAEVTDARGVPRQVAVLPLDLPQIEAF